MRHSYFGRTLCATALACLLPAGASAQSTIAGLVTDATGGVLPGVTVEAASPALIEKVKTTVTDGEGRYRISDLRPGTYAVSFTLPGFNTVRREGLELAADTTIPLNAEMRVGAMEETITVSGATPVVDVQTVGRREVLDRQTMDTLATTRSVAHMAAIIPGIRPSLGEGRAGASGATDNAYISGRGLGTGETVWKLDGMDVRTMQSSGLVNNRPNEAMNQEVTYQTSAVGIESSGGGVQLNMIPREGGNRVSGSAFAGGNGSGMVSEAKLTDALRSLGYDDAGGPPETSTVGGLLDVNYAMGGPIKPDRLWFFGAWRRQYNKLYRANTYDQGDPVSGARNSNNWWFPAAQPGWSQTWVEQTVHNLSGRLTAQLAEGQKLTAYYDRVLNHIGPSSDPYLYQSFPSTARDYTGQAKYTNTLTSRIFVESGYSLASYNHVDTFSPLLTFDRFTPQWYASAPRTDNDTGRVYNHQSSGLDDFTDVDGNSGYRHTVMSNLQYVSGTHAVKVGFTAMTGFYREDSYVNADLVQSYQSGVGFEVSAYNTPSWERNDINLELGLYVGDSWTMKQLTLTGGVRFDRWDAGQHEYPVPAGRFVPWRTVQPAVKAPIQNNVSARMSAAYDVFGNGKTAVKFSFGKYLANVGETTIENYNSNRLTAVGLDWTDTNRDNVAQDSEITEALPDTFGRATSRVLCGSEVAGQRVNCARGDWKRSYNLETTAGIQHELFPNVGVNLMYYHRGVYNLLYSENILVKQSDFFETQIVAPVTGEVVTIYNLPNNLRNVSMLVDTVSTDSNLRRTTYDGLEFGASGRLPGGARVFGGWTIERDVNVNCDQWNKNLLRFCDQSELGIPWRSEYKLAATYRFPWAIDGSLSVVSVAGAQYLGPTFAVNRTRRYDTTFYPTCVAPCVRDALLVPNPLLNAPTITLQLYKPGTSYYDRYNNLNLGLSREFTAPRGRFRIGVDIFNLLNSNTIITRSTVLNNNSVALTMEPRLFRLTGRYTF